MKYHQGRLIDHVHLRVKDLERSRRFYKAVLEAIEMSHAYGGAIRSTESIVVERLTP